MTGGSPEGVGFDSIYALSRDSTGEVYDTSNMITPSKSHSSDANNHVTIDKSYYEARSGIGGIGGIGERNRLSPKSPNKGNVSFTVLD